jgi:hypothetical protein
VVSQSDTTPGAGVLVKGMKVDEFKASSGQRPIAIQSIAEDAGPKRIAVVMNLGPGVPEAERNLEIELAISFLSDAREEDRFALLTVGGSNSGAAFASAADVIAQLKKVSAAAPNSGSHNYDTLLEAAKLLSPPRFGDAVFLFGPPEDDGSAGSIQAVREKFLTNGTRLYGVSLTNPLVGKVPPGWNPNQKLPATFARAPLDVLAADTGYFVSFHQPRALQFPGQLELLKGFLAGLYSGIARPYRLTLPSEHGSDLEIVLQSPAYRGLRNSELHYPHVVPECKGGE